MYIVGTNLDFFQVIVCKIEFPQWQEVDKDASFNFRYIVVREVNGVQFVQLWESLLGYVDNLQTRSR